MLIIAEQSIIFLPARLPNIKMLGDFNFPEVDWANFNNNDTHINILQSFANNVFVKQHVTVPTRESNLFIRFGPQSLLYHQFY